MCMTSYTLSAERTNTTATLTSLLFKPVHPHTDLIARTRACHHTCSAGGLVRCSSQTCTWPLLSSAYSLPPARSAAARSRPALDS